MKSPFAIRSLVALSLSTLLMVNNRSLAEAPTTAPARTEAELVESLRSMQPRLNLLIGNPANMTDAKKRSEIAAEAVPLAKRYRAEYSQLAKLRPAAQGRAAGMLVQLDQALAVLGDAEGAQNLQNTADSSDPAAATIGKTAQLMVRWMTAGKDAAVQAVIADDAEKLARAHSDSAALTVAMSNMSRSSADRATADRLDKLATTVMSNPAVAQVKALDEQLALAEKLMANVGKPFTVAGKTIDGKDFSTSAWLGKVVIVDFWATWCVPCKMALPQLQKFYEAKHAEGLEVLGVSNDFIASDLSTFIAQNKMPWPELFDPAAAAAQRFNSVTTGFGINKIPSMLVIDKKGILRSAEDGVDYEALATSLLTEF